MNLTNFIQGGKVKNLKQRFEKRDASDWQEFWGKEAKEKRNRKLRRGKVERRHRWDKHGQRLRSTWE